MWIWRRVRGMTLCGVAPGRRYATPTPAPTTAPARCWGVLGDGRALAAPPRGGVPPPAPGTPVPRGGGGGNLLRGAGRGVLANSPAPAVATASAARKLLGFLRREQVGIRIVQ